MGPLSLLRRLAAATVPALALGGCLGVGAGTFSADRAPELGVAEVAYSGVDPSPGNIAALATPDRVARGGTVECYYGVFQNPATPRDWGTPVALTLVSEPADRRVLNHGVWVIGRSTDPDFDPGWVLRFRLAGGDLTLPSGFSLQTPNGQIQTYELSRTTGRERRSGDLKISWHVAGSPGRWQILVREDCARLRQAIARAVSDAMARASG